MSIQTNILPDNPQIQVIKSGKTGLFTNYIWKAIPLAFDESMSYYETLLGLLHYLKNVVIPTVNNNADAVAELQALYEELRTYVDDYFKGLDVQEEINNKLDEMVEDGTLQEIISDYLNAKAVFGYDTVQDMKQATNLINGSYAKTLGYHSKNDEGSALYKIRTITNDDVVDEMIIIELADDNLIAEYVNENGVISPEQMGAYGDNIHDDSTVLNAILQIANNKKYEIKGNKTYKTTAPLVIIYNNLRLNLYKINYTGVENAIYFKGKDCILTFNTIQSNGVGIYFTCDNQTTNARNNIEINLIQSQKHGMYFYTNSWGIFEQYIKFTHIIIADNTCYGIYLHSDTSTLSTSYINQIIIYGGRIDGALYALYADASNGQINELLTYNISGESSTNGMYLNKVTDSAFENWRLEELTNETGHLYMKLVGACGNNNFRFNRYAPIELIDRTELTGGGGIPNTIYSNIRDTRQGICIGTIMKFHGPTELDIVSPRLTRSKTIGNDTTLTDLEFVKFFNTSNNPVITTPTVILNGMYGDDGINIFYVYKRASVDSVTFKYADDSSSVTVTRNGLNQITIIGGLLLLQ